MALFTDSGISAIGDLQRYETAILDVAVGEGIDLEVKLGLAQEEIGIELQALLVRMRGAGGSPAPEQLVATPALCQWHRLHALAVIYRDAFHSHLNDRYGAKWKEYSRLTREAKERLLEIGLGYVWAPLPRPKAPELSTNAGIMPITTYLVRMTWNGSSGEEGAPSDVIVQTTGDNTQLMVTPPPPPSHARFWSLYAGLEEGTITRQNAAPLGLNEPWTVPVGGLVNGSAVPVGQSPDAYLTRVSSFRRG